VSWVDQRVLKLAAEKAAQLKLAQTAQEEMKKKNALLKNALAKTAQAAKFAKADVKGKAAIIANLHNEGLLG